MGQTGGSHTAVVAHARAPSATREEQMVVWETWSGCAPLKGGEKKEREVRFGKAPLQAGL